MKVDVRQGSAECCAAGRLVGGGTEGTSVQSVARKRFGLVRPASSSDEKGCRRRRPKLTSSQRLATLDSLVVNAKAAMSLVTALALSPWRLSLQWLSCCAGLLFTLLSRVGVPPAGFVEKSKVRGAEGRAPSSGAAAPCTRTALTSSPFRPHADARSARHPGTHAHP